MKHLGPSQHRPLAWFALLLGFLGMLVCLAAGIVTWKAGSRVERANTLIFQMLDSSLGAAQERVVQVQKRSQEWKITTQEIKERVETWAAEETRQRLAARLNLGEKAESISAGLHQAEEMLDISKESVRLARRSLELGKTCGASVRPDSLDPLFEKLDTLQNRLREAMTIIEQVRKLTEETSDGDTQPGGVQRVLVLIVRVVATFGEIDKHLGELAERLAEVRNDTAKLETRLHRYILGCEVGISLLLIWMACGQVMLFRYGCLRTGGTWRFRNVGLVSGHDRRLEPR